MSVQSHVIVPPHYTEQVRLTSRLRQQAKREAIKAEKRRLEWCLVPDSHLAIKLHQNTGKLPAGVALSVPREIALSLITRRLATPTGDSTIAPDAIIECDFADVDLA